MGFPLPKLDSDHMESLEALIRNQGIIDAIDSLKANKSPGPDGFMAEFYFKKLNLFYFHIFRNYMHLI